jgi:hypothetical protein
MVPFRLKKIKSYTQGRETMEASEIAKAANRLIYVEYIQVVEKNLGT